MHEMAIKMTARAMLSVMMHPNGQPYVVRLGAFGTVDLPLMLTSFHPKALLSFPPASLFFLPQVC